MLISQPSSSVLYQNWVLFRGAALWPVLSFVDCFAIWAWKGSIQSPLDHYTISGPSWILSETIWKLTWIVWADFPYQECPFFALLVLSDNFGIILVKIHTACHSSIILCLLIWAKSAERESGLKWTLSEQESAGQNLKTLSIYFIGQRWLLSQELSNFQARNYLQNSFKYHLFALLTQPPLSVLQAC